MEWIIAILIGLAFYFYKTGDPDSFISSGEYGIPTRDEYSWDINDSIEYFNKLNSPGQLEVRIKLQEFNTHLSTQKDSKDYLLKTMNDAAENRRNEMKGGATWQWVYYSFVEAICIRCLQNEFEVVDLFFDSLFEKK